MSAVSAADGCIDEGGFPLWLLSLCSEALCGGKLGELGGCAAGFSSLGRAGWLGAAAPSLWGLPAKAFGFLAALVVAVGSV